jgi:3-dehydroquinate dehydratase-2
MSSLHVLVLNGPNLDRLGTREPGLYGAETLAAILERLEASAGPLDVRLSHFQSAWEGALVERVHQARDEGVAGLVVNAAAYTHPSVALRDALLAAGLPFVEVHLSNVHAREPFRHDSLLADIAVGVVTGFGGDSYLLGLRGLVAHLQRSEIEG